MPRKGLGALGVALLLVTLLIPVEGAASASTSRNAVIDPAVLDDGGYQSVIVHLRADASMSAGIADVRAAGAEIGTRYGVINVFVAYGNLDTLLEAADSPHVEALEANAPLEHFTNTSHVATRGQEVLDGAVTLRGGERIDGSGIGVAVVDSGIDGTHPDLASRMGGNVKIICSTPQFVVTSLTGGFTQCLGPKVTVNAEDTDTLSGGGHGTHVAGIVAGTGSASGGKFHGAAPDATLYGVSVGTVLVVENALDGLAWVLENHDKVSPEIKVVNNSWGSGYRPYDPENGPFHKATWKLQEALVADGVTVVFAAGNSGGDGSRPTTSAECINPTPGIVCVANYSDRDSGTRDGVIDGSSSRGHKDQPENWPDLSAPGTRIVSTCRLTLPVCSAHRSPELDPPNTYSTLSGTSMAAPHVSGIVAQLYEVNSALTPAQVEDVLEDTAYKFSFGSPYVSDPFNPDDTSSFEKGHGLVDVCAAVRAVGTKRSLRGRGCRS
jgi:serine protease AprX